MSTYTSSTVTVDARLASLYGTASAEHEAVMHGLCSADAVALSAEIALFPATESVDLDLLWSRIDDSLAGWQAHLPAESIVTLDACHQEPSGLSAALDSVAQVLAAQERLALVDLSEAALTGLGYDIQRVDGERTSAIEARRNHETFLVIVEDQGMVTTDHVGLADASCSDRQQDYVDAMGRLGALFDDEITVQHHDPRGGSPVANAARAGGQSLAEGAVLEGDARRTALVSSLLPSTSAAARTGHRA